MPSVLPSLVGHVHADAEIPIKLGRLPAQLGLLQRTGEVSEPDSNSRCRLTMAACHQVCTASGN